MEDRISVRGHDLAMSGVRPNDLGSLEIFLKNQEPEARRKFLTTYMKNDTFVIR